MCGGSLVMTSVHIYSVRSRSQVSRQCLDKPQPVVSSLGSDVEKSSLREAAAVFMAAIAASFPWLRVFDKRLIFCLDVSFTRVVAARGGVGCHVP